MAAATRASHDCDRIRRYVRATPPDDQPITTRWREVLEASLWCRITACLSPLTTPISLSRMCERFQSHVAGLVYGLTETYAHTHPRSDRFLVTIRPQFDPATDYYRILGVKPDATSEDIHVAYRRLARAYHPDLHPGSAAAVDRMARINAAKSVLLNPQARAAHDLSRNGGHLASHRVHAPTATPNCSRRFDYSTAMLLVVMAPLMLGLLVYLVCGVLVAVRPLPVLVC